MVAEFDANIVAELKARYKDKEAREELLTEQQLTKYSTAFFSPQTRSFAAATENLKIILIDGEQLAQLMIDRDVGVTEESRYIVKKVDLDYFGDE